WFLASLIFASASLVLLYSRNVRFMSTVPIFIPCARTTTGRTNKVASVKKSSFFIRGLNKSSETLQTASPNMRLKLVADAEVKVGVFAISSGVDGEAVIEPKRPNRQVEPDANSEIGGEGVEGFARSRDRRWKGCAGVVEFIPNLRRDGVISAWDVNRARSQVPGIGIDEPAVIENRAARFFDDRETHLDSGPDQGLATDRLVVGILGAYVTQPESAQIVRTSEIQPIVNGNV